ncbi:MAG: TPR end-of-group domain-containing protein [Bacteroidota bacterium]
MKSFRLFFLTLCVACSLFSCSSGNNEQKIVPQTKDSVVTKENFETGKILERIVCKKDTSQSFAMYLPKNYSTEKTFPIVIAFDPQGTGKLPVSLYKDLAEQYNYIIVGSNNSKNGLAWEETKQIAGKLFADLATRLAINMERIYLLGFSGGARIANGITIENGSIAGAICCGAAAPSINSTQPRNNYTFLAVVGNEDFNYLEVRKYDMVDLAGHNVKHGLITFNGKHQWPAKDIMDEGFWWLELNEMRKNSSVKNDTLIAKRFHPVLKQIEMYQKNNQTFEAYRLCQKAITFYDGLTDLTYCYNLYRSFQTNPDIDKALRAEEKMWSKEEKQKGNYMQALQKENLNWWKKEISSIDQKIKTEKNKEEILIYKRILNYLSLVCYMQTTGALSQNNIPAAEHFGRLYVLIDPTNNESHYLMASVNAKQGKIQEAITALNSAVKNGFADVARLKNDVSFNAIKNTKEFEKIVEKLNTPIRNSSAAAENS